VVEALTGAPVADVAVEVLPRDRYVLSRSALAVAPRTNASGLFLV
jgi:hypothetical protein